MKLEPWVFPVPAWLIPALALPNKISRRIPGSPCEENVTGTGTPGRSSWGCREAGPEPPQIPRVWGIWILFESRG